MSAPMTPAMLQLLGAHRDAPQPHRTDERASTRVALIKRGWLRLSQSRRHTIITASGKEAAGQIT